MSCRISWLDINYQTPSLANKRNLSLSSKFIFISSGSWVTPIGFEMLSPMERLIANPCAAELIKTYFCWEARLGVAQRILHFHHEKHGFSPHVSISFSFPYHWKAYDPQKDRLAPNTSYPLNRISRYLPCRLKIALESPTLAQVSNPPFNRIDTIVEPLHSMLIRF